MKNSKNLLEAAGGKDGAGAFGLRCKVYAKNSTPSDWNVVIVGAGVEFIYKDGDTEKDGASDLNVKSGQEQQFSESDPAKCVKKLKGLLRYKFINSGDEGISEDESDDVPSGQCAAGWVMEIEPALTVREDVKGGTPPLRLVVSKFE